MKKIKITLLTIIYILASLVVGNEKTLVFSSKPYCEINAVVLVEFSSAEITFDEKNLQVISEVFSQNKGLDGFINANSNGKERVDSRVLGTVKISQEEKYFMPKFSYDYIEKAYKVVNEIGYDNRFFDKDGNPSTTGKQSAERFYREQELISAVCEKASEISSDINSENYKIKSLTVVTSEDGDFINQSILWPHQATYFSGSVSEIEEVYFGNVKGEIKEGKLADKSINDYILMPFGAISNGEQTSITTIAHEYMHVLGAPDYYSYDGKDSEGVSEFDIMGGESRLYPNLSLSYTRERMGFLSEGKEILPLAKSGEYTLYPTVSDSEVKAYKIILPDFYQKGESFYIEYRKNGEGEIEKLTSNGLIIYRVNERNGFISPNGEVGNSWYGNAYGKNEVYIFRFWREIFGSFEERDEIIKNGICYATVSSKQGYDGYGNKVGKENSITYSDGTNSLVTVKVVSENQDGSITFKVEIPPTDYQIPSGYAGVKILEGGRTFLNFDRWSESGKAYLTYSDKKIKNPSGQDLKSGKYGEVEEVALSFTRYKVDGKKGKYLYLVYDDGELSSVYTYQVGEGNYDELTKILIFSVVVGLSIPTAIAVAIILIRKKRSKKL